MKVSYMYLFFVTTQILVFYLFEQARKLQERGWQPRWFKKDEDGCFRYMGDYWETRDEKDWKGIPDIFGQSVGCVEEENEE